MDKNQAITQEEIDALIRGSALTDPSPASLGPDDSSPLQSKPSSEPVGSTPRLASAQGAGSAAQVRPAVFPVVAREPSHETPRNLDLLMDVALDVTVELGRMRRSIRDVLALAPGYVLELDRLANEEVDVLVNGKVVAKAEVVVVDENYGARITEIRQ